MAADEIGEYRLQKRASAANIGHIDTEIRGGSLE
jgi:S-adenosylhomocysteine hydrolase